MLSIFKAIVKLLISTLVYFLALPIMAQDAFVLLPGSNLLEAKTIKYSNRISVKITPEIYYSVDKRNELEIITVQFKAKWYRNENITTPDDERIFIINDPEYFLNYCDKSKGNWKVKQQVKNSLTETFKFSPDGLVKKKLSEVPEFFTDSTRKVTLEISRSAIREVSMAVTFYLGTYISTSGYSLEQKAGELKWKFIPKPGSGLNCDQKLAQYQRIFGECQIQQKMSRYDEITGSWESKSLKDLMALREEITGYPKCNLNLNELLNKINEDITTSDCKNLSGLKAEIESYTNWYRIREYDIRDLITKISNKIDGQAIDVNNVVNVDTNVRKIRVIYHKLKHLQWDFIRTQSPVDSVSSARIENELKDLKKVVDASFENLLTFNKVNADIKFNKEDFDSYYDASMIIIKSFSQTGDLKNKGDSGKKPSSSSGKKWNFLLWILIPVVIIIAAIFLMKYMKRIKRAESIKNMIKPS